MKQCKFKIIVNIIIIVTILMMKQCKFKITFVNIIIIVAIRMRRCHNTYEMMKQCKFKIIILISLSLSQYLCDDEEAKTSKSLPSAWLRWLGRHGDNHR